jgi:hypothetical protein
MDNVTLRPALAVAATANSLDTANSLHKHGAGFNMEIQSAVF